MRRFPIWAIIFSLVYSLSPMPTKLASADTRIQSVSEPGAAFNPDMNLDGTIDLFDLIKVIKTDPANVGQVIQHYGESNTQSEEQKQQLFSAIYNGDVEAVRTLLEAGLDPDTKNDSGTTGLNYAISFNMPEIADLFIDARADLSLPDTMGYTPLVTATRNDMLHTVQKLLAAGADPNLPEASFGETPIFYALTNGNVEMLTTLFEAQADPNFKDHQGKTAVMYFGNYNTDLLQLFMERGLNLDLQDQEGKTLLIHAVTNNLLEVVQQLLNAGADPNIQDHSDLTAYDYAVNFGYTDIANLLPKPEIPMPTISLKNSTGPVGSKIELNIESQSDFKGALFLDMNKNSLWEDIEPWVRVESSYGQVGLSRDFIIPNVQAGSYPIWYQHDVDQPSSEAQNVQVGTYSVTAGESKVVTIGGQEWNWVSPKNQATVNVENDTVSISSSATHENIINAPKLSRTVTGNFHAQLNIQWPRNYGEIGFYVYDEKNTYLRFSYWFKPSSQSGTRAELTQNTVSNTVEGKYHQVRYNIQLVRDGNHFTFYGKTDRENIWRKMSEWTVDNLPNQVTFGVQAVNPDSPFDISFTNLNVKEGLPINAYAPTPWDLSHAVAYNDEREIGFIQSLIDAGADPNYLDPGERPLTELLEYADTTDMAILDALLKAGAYVNYNVPYAGPDERGRSLLWLTIYNGNTEATKALLKAGADPNQYDYYSSTSPLTLAAQMGNEEIVQLLLNYRANPNLLGTEYEPGAYMGTELYPLMGAVKYPAIVELLLNYGADPKQKNKEGKTALDYALDPVNGNEESAVKIKNRLPKPAFHSLQLINEGRDLEIRGENFPENASGMVWLDLNNDGKLNGSEQGIPAQTSSTGTFVNPVLLTIPADAQPGYTYFLNADIPSGGDLELNEFYQVPTPDQQRAYGICNEECVGMIKNSYLDSFGRNPDDAEIEYWKNRTDWLNTADLIEKHRLYLKADMATRENTIKRSYEAVFWRGPNQDELNYWNNQLVNSGQNYKELIENHKKYIQVSSEFREALVINSFSAALGRQPSSGELESWMQSLQTQPLTFWELLEHHKNLIKTNGVDYHRPIIEASYQKAFGRSPKPDEVTFWSNEMTTNGTMFGDMVQRHKDYLKIEPSFRNEIIQRSYQTVFARDPLSGEYQYWEPRIINEGLLYDQLVSLHQDWANDNAEYLSQNTSLTEVLANQDLSVDTTGNLVSITSGGIIYEQGDWVIGRLDASGNVIAAGGGNVIAAGGGNVIAAGGGNVIAAGGGNVIAAGGGNVIAAGGGNVIAAGGGNVIAAGGGNVIAAGGLN